MFSDPVEDDTAQANLVQLTALARQRACRLLAYKMSPPRVPAAITH
jgi:hypothetical protein